MAGLGAILCASVTFRLPLLLNAIEALRLKYKIGNRTEVKKRVGDFILTETGEKTHSPLISMIFCIISLRYKFYTVL